MKKAPLPTCVLVAVALGGCSDDAGSDIPTGVDIPTEGGTVHGKVAGGSRAFLGIPYAAPPVGDLRWRAPQPAAPWQGVRDATEVGPICPQPNLVVTGLDGRSSEDCLTLQVWSPEPAPSEPVPVMVWIHGGGYLWGAGSETYYEGQRLVEVTGAVIVTLNYRLGPMGFLAHADLSAEEASHPSSGNYGIEDQQAALGWVQRNIHAFGGDPANVTIFGESAGGNSVCVHLVSPASRGLFHRGISESGLCASGYASASLAGAETAGAVLATALGCDGAGALACLRDKSIEEVFDALPVPAETPGGPFYDATDTRQAWGPVADGMVLPDTVTSLLLAGQAAPVPVLLGTNRDEGTLFHSPPTITAVADEQEYRDALTRTFGAAVDAIVERYPPAAFDSANRALAEVTGDAFFVCPARRTARAIAAAAPTYLYAFQREPADPLLPDLGVLHGAELAFVFGTDVPLGKVAPGDEPLSLAMQAYWGRFAASGDPNGEGAVPWPRYDTSSDANIVLDLPIVGGSAHKREQCDFWDSLLDG
jgi:para-nitrobenzyl esterase